MISENKALINILKKKLRNFKKECLRKGKRVHCTTPSHPRLDFHIRAIGYWDKDGNWSTTPQKIFNYQILNYEHQILKLEEKIQEEIRMKTHFTYKEINRLIDLTKADLRTNFEMQARKKARLKSFNIDPNKSVEVDFLGLITDAEFLEEILAKLSIAKKKCELKYQSMMDHTNDNKKRG